MSRSGKKKPQARPVISSFSVIKGSLIEATYEALRHWDFSLSRKDNFSKIQEENMVGAQSSNWLFHVLKAIKRRYDPELRDRALVEAAQSGMELSVWKPVLLWHFARSEFLVHSFLTHYLYDLYCSEKCSLTTQDVFPFFRNLSAQGFSEPQNWTKQTSSRVASGLLRIAVDFDLMQGKTQKHFSSFHLPEKSFVYLLHAIYDQAQNPAALISSPDWKLFWYAEADVERELLRLHQYRKLIYERAGSVIQLQLPAASGLDFIRGIAHE